MSSPAFRVYATAIKEQSASLYLYWDFFDLVLTPEKSEHFLLSPLLGIDLIYYFHRYLATIATVLVVAHVLILLWRHPAAVGSVDPRSAPVHMTLIYLALRNVAQKWKRPPQFWSQARSEFAIRFGERFKVVSE